MADVAGVDRVKVRGLPTIALTAAGVFSRPIRTMRTLLYQFDEPFEIETLGERRRGSYEAWTQ